MYSHFKKLSVFVLLVCTQISCAQRKPKLYTVSGTVTATYSYCGGARPSAEMLAELNRPKPMPEQTFYIKSGTANLKSRQVIKSFTTDANGNFTVKLASGSYCIIDENKSESFKIPVASPNQKWDADCLNKEYERCNYQLNISAKQTDSVNINYFVPCEWNKPCLEYTGPLPPATQQRY